MHSSLKECKDIMAGSSERQQQIKTRVQCADRYSALTGTVR